MADLKKKQIPLRLSSKLYAAIASWAEDDFRSVNGQIEYLLTECVKQRKKDGKYVSEPLTNHLKSILNNKKDGRNSSILFIFSSNCQQSLLSRNQKKIKFKHHDYAES